MRKPRWALTANLCSMLVHAACLLALWLMGTVVVRPDPTLQGDEIVVLLALAPQPSAFVPATPSSAARLMEVEVEVTPHEAQVDRQRFAPAAPPRAQELRQAMSEHHARPPIDVAPLPPPAPSLERVNDASPPHSTERSPSALERSRESLEARLAAISPTPELPPPLMAGPPRSSKAEPAKPAAARARPDAAPATEERSLRSPVAGTTHAESTLNVEIALVRPAPAAGEPPKEATTDDSRTRPLERQLRPAPLPQMSALAAPPSPQRPLGVQGADELSVPRLVYNPPPVYPAEAQRRGWEGVVWLDVDLDREAAVQSVRVAVSSGREILDAAAVRTVRSQWRFEPPAASAATADQTVRIYVRFRLP